MQGLRFQDVKEISPWEILEGVKNSGPLMLSWFGAVRMKRKPLRCEEQRNLVRFHTHQNQSQNFISGPHTVKLPTEETVPVPVNPPTDISKALTAPDSAQGDAPKQGVVPGAATLTSGGVGMGGASGGSMGMPTHPSGGPQPGGPIGQTVPGVAGAQMAEGGNVAMTGPQRPGVNPVVNMPQQMHPHMMNPQFRPGGQMRVTAPGDAMHERQFMASQSDAAMMKHRLNKIYMMNTDTGGGVPTMYAPNMAGSMMVPGGHNPGHRRLQAFQQHHRQQQHQQYLRLMRERQMQQQQQQQQMMGQQYGPPGGPYRSNPAHMSHMMNPRASMSAGMHPMQANPPIQMQQVMQQRQPGTYHQQGMGAHPGMGPPGQPAYQGAPPPGMNQGMHRSQMF